MTNAIEQSKREMYRTLDIVKMLIGDRAANSQVFQKFESALESHLELLRQDHEALHETARKRFDDIQSLEAVNKDLIEQLGNMTERRDYFRNQVQAANHACKTRQDQSATPTQDSGDRASCATPDGKTMALLGALVDAKRIITDYLVPDGIRAKDAIAKLIPVLDNVNLVMVMREFEQPKCMHSFFAIGQDQMKCTFCGVGK